ncbi:unnamed protein product [Soboliphyme baturini]|uniref:Glycosyltransferase-like protein LARGE1 n=1 Tax=Soboliphyme baturini TaxID=241478 RepID=A0A183IFM6_9BILA|nr:unnamed protein product [Soboliphyme baturini]
MQAPGIPKILIGNRLHLEFRRQISRNYAEHFAGKRNMEYFEVSPLASFNVRESLTELSRLVLMRNGMERLWKSSKGFHMNKRSHTMENRFSFSEWAENQWTSESMKRKKTEVNCEVVHVAVICCGSSAVRSLVVMLKSILLHRRRPLHLHLVTDTVRSQNVLSHLLDTWNVTSLDFSIYLSTNFSMDVAWIPTFHHSSLSGLLKLTVPSILPQNLKKVILLDTDLIFLSDIGSLWDMFELFNSEQCLGIAENLSNWYLRKQISGKLSRWPAKGTGFNTGVVLMDLETLRVLSWTSLYTQITKEQLKIINATQLGDQDVVNAIIKQYPEFVFQLPCVYNFQLVHVHETIPCSTLVSDIKVLHFNSRKKYREATDFAHSLLVRYQYFDEMSGSYLRHNFMECTDLATNSYAVSDNVDVSLVTHLTIERLPLLEKFLSRWRGPASVSLYVSDTEAYRFIQFLKRNRWLNRDDVAFHIVYREGALYPVNKLRNVALDQVVTAYVFLTDVDFIPVENLYEMLIKAIRNEGNLNNRALIVPVFETFKYDLDYPKTKSELLKMLDNEEVFIFKQRVFPAGHKETDFHRWRNAKLPYKVNWRMNFEPYIVVRSDVVRYDTRFVGYGWNKMSHIMKLHFIGYEFIVLPHVFIVHSPHLISSENTMYRGSQQYRRCMNALKIEFMQELHKRYPQNHNRIVEMPHNSTK